MATANMATANSGGWTDGWWSSADGLRLHYRDYPGDAGHVPVVCIPGLTRNARDFADLAARLSPSRRVIVVELRGRGGSERAPDFESYNAGVYLGDVRALLDALCLPRVVIVGTSLGGIIAMLLTAGGDPRVAGVLLNDIGPVVEEAGLAHIRTYIGNEARWPDWDAAAASLAATHGGAFPAFAASDWRAMAERLCSELDGAIAPDYDPAIAILVNMPAEPPAEPWRLISGLAEMPVLLVRGVLSDILSGEVAAEMARRLPQMETITLEAIGHPPLLDEDGVPEAIDRLLAKADAIG